MSALSQITKRAKQLRSANKKLAWKDAIKKASAEYRSKHKPAAAKKAVKKKPARKKALGKKPVKKSVGKKPASKKTVTRRSTEVTKIAGAASTQALAAIKDCQEIIAIQKTRLLQLRDRLSKVGKDRHSRYEIKHHMAMCRSIISHRKKAITIFKKYL